MPQQLATGQEKLISILVWATGLIAFGVLGGTIVFLSLFINPKHFDGFVKWSCRAILRALFIRVKVEGLENVPPNRTLLFMANHVNIFDVFVLYGHIPAYVRGVELEDHFSWPFYGRIIRRLGMIPISHSNGRAAIKSLEKAKNAIATGTSIVILPEGGRTLDGRFRPFKRGAFLLAKQAGVDIVPMVMIGAFRINKKGDSLIRPGVMTLSFGAPIRYEEFGDLKTEEILALVRERMLLMFVPPGEMPLAVAGFTAVG